MGMFVIVIIDIYLLPHEDKVHLMHEEEELEEKLERELEEAEEAGKLGVQTPSGDFLLVGEATHMVHMPSIHNYSKSKDLIEQG
eukprot:TRINITY_DN751_c0_g1_i1.p3 TRINITY_DN751_c0_g1~~TRINITY_DN751_c0_g1_i1.p3  ORF type:complete len:95 (+),score=24.14 TRINITY_DN751_c0_g1_i1:35-286(+)